MKLIIAFLFGIIFIINCDTNSKKVKIESFKYHQFDSIKIDKLMKSGLINSVWQNNMREYECVDILTLKLKDYFTLDFNCEVKDSIFGEWTIIQDTIILESRGSFYDLTTNLYEAKSDFDKMKWKIIIANDTMKWLYSYTWDLNTNSFDNGRQLDTKYNNFTKMQ